MEKSKTAALSANAVIEVSTLSPTDATSIANVMVLDHHHHAASRKDAVAPIERTADGEAVSKKARHENIYSFQAIQPQRVRFEPAALQNK